MNDQPQQPEASPPTTSQPKAGLLRRRPFWSTAVAVLLLAAILHGPLLRGFGRLFTAERPLEAFDRVWIRAEDFSVSGDGAIERAVGLCREDAGRRVLLVEQAPMPCVRAGVVPPQSEAIAAKLHRRGLAADRIEVAPGAAYDLATEAQALGAWLRAHEDSRILLLCRRLSGGATRAILDRELGPDLAARVGILGLPSQGIDESNWWTSRTGFKEMLTSMLDRVHCALGGVHRTASASWDYEGFEADMAAETEEEP